MIQKKDWVKLLALLVFMTLMGGYYERLSPDTRTMILPLAIFVVALFFLFQLRKIQFEMRTSSVVAYKIMTNALSFVDSKGNERASVSSDNAIMTFYGKFWNKNLFSNLWETKEVSKLPLTTMEHRA
jgi:hypothetical protein